MVEDNDDIIGDDCDQTLDDFDGTCWRASFRGLKSLSSL